MKGSSPPECRLFGAAERKQGWAPKGFAKQTRRAARRAVLLGALAGDGAATRLVGRSGLLPAPTAELVEDLERSPRRFAQGVYKLLRLACTATHIYAAPLHVGSEQARLEPPPGVVGTDKTGAMQDPASGLPRILIPRTWVNSNLPPLTDQDKLIYTPTK